MSNAEKTRQYFDLVSEDYEQKSNSRLWKRLRKLESDTVLDFLPEISDRTILDACCGSGFYTRMLARLNPRSITAVDLSAKMIEGLSGSKIKAIQGNVSTLHFDDKFDVILCAGGLEFMDDPGAFFSASHKSSKENGHLTVLAPAGGLFGAIYKVFHKGHGLNVHLFNRQALKDLGEAHGWKLLKVRQAHPFAIVGSYEKQH